MDPSMSYPDMSGGVQVPNMGMSMNDMFDNPGLLGDLDGGMLPMDLDLDSTFDNMSALQPHLPHQNSNESTNTNDFMQSDDGANTGAGPLPTGFGMGPQASGVAVTDFTKRRNWSQRVIEELRDFLHILTPDGRILYVSPSCKGITGYEPHELIGKFIGEYIHPDDSAIFMREFNESIASLNPLRFFYRFRKSEGSYVIFECDGHGHVSADSGMMGYNNMGGMNNGGAMVQSNSATCKGFFMMSRPYPTRNAALLDSFLEHKIENERLLKRIEELKREELEENEAQERQWQESVPASDTQGNLSSADPNFARTPNNYQGMPPPAKPSISNIALTRQNLDSALSSQRPDSIADKMSRYEGANHVDTIEMLTGLQFREGERSHGISTGDTSPALIRGDAGIAIVVDRDREDLKEKKKKIKVADEYVCSDCGTLDSPEWRKGPKGPKTLCNACGLRWAKKEKKRAGPDTGGNTPMAGDSKSAAGGAGGSMGTPVAYKTDMSAS